MKPSTTVDDIKSLKMNHSQPVVASMAMALTTIREEVIQRKVESPQHQPQPWTLQPREPSASAQSTVSPRCLPQPWIAWILHPFSLFIGCSIINKTLGPPSKGRTPWEMPESIKETLKKLFQARGAIRSHSRHRQTECSLFPFIFQFVKCLLWFLWVVTFTLWSNFL